MGDSQRRQSAGAPPACSRPIRDGTAMHIQPGSLDMSAASAVAVTLEDAAGADAPTTTPSSWPLAPALQ